MTRQAHGRFRDGEIGYSLKRVLRQNMFVFIIASTVVVAIVATMVQQTPSHAATPAEGVTWNPGPVDFSTDKTGCFTNQDATFQSDSAALATTIKNVLEKNWYKTDFPADSPIQALEISDVEGGSSKMNVHLYGVLSNADCAAVTSAGRSAVAGAPAASPAVQAAGLRAGQGTGAASPAVNLDNGKGIQLAASTSWTKAAWIALAAVALYVAVTIVATAGLVAAAGLAGVVLEGAATVAMTAAAGCMASQVAWGTVVALTGKYPDWKTQIISQVGTCILGAGAALGPVGAAGIAVGNALRVALGGYPVATIGNAATGPGELLGIQMTNLANVVQAAGYGARYASG